MSSIPWELKLTLRCGAVYYLQDRTLSSGEPHYFIVANRDPFNDQLLLLAVASSQIEKVKKRRATLPTDTLIEISPDQYGDFTKPTIIDCNRLITRSLAEFVEQWQRKDFLAKAEIPKEIMAKIKLGVSKSPMIDQESKDLL